MAAHTVDNICTSHKKDNKIFREETQRLADKYLSHEELTQGIDRLTKIKERDNVIHVNFKPDRDLQ